MTTSLSASNDIRLLVVEATSTTSMQMDVTPFPYVTLHGFLIWRQTAPVWLPPLLLLRSGDVEQNPGPRPGPIPAYPCAGCGRNVLTNAIQCTMCLLWVHQRCSGLKTIPRKRPARIHMSCLHTKTIQRPTTHLYYKTNTKKPPQHAATQYRRHQDKES